MRTALLLALAFLATALPAGSLAPADAGYDLAAVKAQLQRDLPGPEWAMLPDAAEPVATWVLPAGAIGMTLDTRTLTVGPPQVAHDEEDAGCTDYGGAFAVWEPSPPGVYPTCTGAIEHTGGITEITLICAGPAPGFGCAHVGVDRDRRNVYFMVLCGYPEGPVFGIAWPDQGLFMQCKLYGENPVTWQRWAATLSANGPLLTHGALSH